MELTQQVKLKTASLLIENLTSISDATRAAALSELRLLTKLDPDIRPIIATFSNGVAISNLAENLYSTTPLSQENAAAILLNLSISSKQPLIATRGFLHALSHALSSHRTDYSSAAVQSAAATVYSLSLQPDLRPKLGSMRDLVYYLVDIVASFDSPSQSVKDAVKALFGISLCPENRKNVIDLGGILALFARVAGDGRVGVVEDVTAVIAQLAGCDAAPAGFRSVGGVRVLLDLIVPGEDQQATRRVKENAVSALLKLVEFGGQTVVEEITDVGLDSVLDGLREVVCSGTDKGKFRAQGLMNVLETGMSTSIKFSEIGSGFGSSPLLESTHSY
ncbi:U-box domain-containing protein 17-like [Silene latifolia]|uniref:U-box domain-containing protein 17-like n=1 Tax=Silene latifolia TaxID=37657 RepID=UPI003D784A5C